MNANVDGRGLDALLDMFAPPPIPADLVERVSAAACAVRQEEGVPPLPAVSPPRHDRRGKWFRRPLLVGAAAFGLAFSGAVAATFAGVRLPAKVEAVIAKLPFVASEIEAPAAPAPRPVRPPSRPSVSRAEAAPLVSPAMIRSPTERRARNVAALRQRVVARREAGLPTPVADRIERAIERRRALTPAERIRLVEERRARIRARIEARRAAAAPAELETEEAPPGEEVGASLRTDREARIAQFRERREMLLQYRREGFGRRDR